jgi:hypothetical protein
MCQSPFGSVTTSTHCHERSLFLSRERVDWFFSHANWMAFIFLSNHSCESTVGRSNRSPISITRRNLPRLQVGISRRQTYTSARSVVLSFIALCLPCPDPSQLHSLRNTQWRRGWLAKLQNNCERSGVASLHHPLSHNIRQN